jgi:hypothetical protein
MISEILHAARPRGHYKPSNPEPARRWAGGEGKVEKAKREAQLDLLLGMDQPKTPLANPNARTCYGSFSLLGAPRAQG